MRLAAYLLLFLDRITGRAAVHESVDLVKRARKTSAAPFANAVLRKLAASAPVVERASGDDVANAVPRPFSGQADPVKQGDAAEVESAAEMSE